MVPVREHEKYAKFFKLQKMGMPVPQIELKMQSEGLDASLLETPEKLIPVKEKDAEEEEMVPVREHEKYAKFFKLQKMGMPVPQIELKMQSEGLDASLIETPEKMIPVKEKKKEVE